MACGGAKKLIQIGTTVDSNQKQSPKKARTETKRTERVVISPKPPVPIHVCAECGYKGPHLKHTCKPESKVGFVETRKSWCARCRYSKDNVCLNYKTLHPERDCFIDVGVAIPNAACPAKFWPRVLLVCKVCGESTFDENGVYQCKKCNAKRNDACSLPFLAVDFKEKPLEAKSKFLVVTLAAGQHALDMNAYTGKRMREYAERCGADYHEITDNRYPEYPLANKFRLKNLVKNYERVLFLDADVWINDYTENLFDWPGGCVWMHHDALKIADLSWLAHESTVCSTEQRIPKLKLLCLNTGVVLFDAAHADIWSPPPLPSKARHLIEQTWVEYQVRTMGIPISFLPTAYNTQWWFEDFKELEPNAAFLHLASCPPEERMYRIHQLQRRASVAEPKLPQNA